MKLLLDTCTFLWYLTGSRELPGDVVERIRHSGNQVSLSAVSFWEISVKYQLGRLPLPEAPASYVPRQRDRHSIASLPLEEAAVRHLVKLPTVHSDPFDRMLVCQAIEHDLTIVTPDEAVTAYPVKTCWN